MLYENKFHLCGPGPGDNKQKTRTEEKGGQINSVAAVTQAITSHPYIMSFKVVAASCLCFHAAFSVPLVTVWL